MSILDKKIKQKWLKALRSGKYRQTRTGQLYSESSNAYCCLGVLQHCLTGEVEDDSSPSTEWYEKHLGVQLDDNDLRLFKVAKNNGACWLRTPEEKLIRLNDNNKKNFSQIADWIEENL
jgi:hypothetical protein